MSSTTKIYNKYKESLMKLAQKKGYLTPDDILEIFPEIEDAYKATEELTSNGVSLFIDDAAPFTAIASLEKMLPSNVSLNEEPAKEETLSAFLGRLGEVKKFTEEERQELLVKAKKGDEKAMQALLESHQPLIVHFAKKYSKKGFPIYDLIQEGNLGLLKAINKYEPGKKAQFLEFAGSLIQKAMKKFIKTYANMLNIPHKIINIIRRLHSASITLAQKLGRVPKLQEITKQADIPLKQVQEIIKTSAVPLSFETPVGQDAANTLGENIQDASEVVWDKILSEDKKEQLLEAITILPPLEQQLLSLHYGMIDEQQWSLKELAAFFNFSESKVRKLKDKAIKLLRNKYQKQGTAP